MSITTYLDTASQIWYWSLPFGIYMCIYALVFPYIFLLVDCFEWALIGDIEQQRVHSVLWQFQMGDPSVLPPGGKSENLSSK